MKSFSAILYVEPAVRSTGAPVHEPSAACRTTPVTRLPATAAMSYVTHRPATCGNRPSAAGIWATPFSTSVLNSTPIAAYLVGIASLVTLPTSDSHVRPAVLPQASVLGMAREEDPMTVPRMGASWALRSSIRAWMAAFGVTPMSHGLCQSAVL